MSYSYLLMKIGRRFETTADLAPEDALPLGEPEDVANGVSSVFPEVRWDETSHEGDLDLEGRWFEFRVLEQRPVISVGVRTSFRHESKDVVERICDALGWAAFDGQTAKVYIPAVAATSGEAGWRDFN